jgi:hypothetical protein
LKSRNDRDHPPFFFVELSQTEIRRIPRNTLAAVVGGGIRWGKRAI